ncbi:MAG: hypothetical protein A2600_10760 [Candidatus Lambdaproteobacteria bacterium RIFOXYD1_FULL_56_27]|uniref:Uncharacterized protein n=1 Tax=Candidatus Lambdaproteobacteria bacterium RIFOXYD2_FULL_56_26 TaxID=1817773 RepID=A0A1F6GVJ7_9PROT|nr:MAG: hypothetical protein A2426_01580 [Candidatus Lambdaproteobacteria bacterium RIFOXYC1_FULL_56_13]OGH02060.1 MAG: hypothetical protein A2557_10480 [Candidatus Lambdaproteobacteria bacterium RIFOXYD2_FULL_56_26]OGH07710.1 MAG: hypothetical protein A2600_10760 [Candidatus Lambdaproteobacteria bacterium RIFOXYD1_FULL_56_27]
MEGIFFSLSAGTAIDCLQVGRLFFKKLSDSSVPSGEIATQKSGPQKIVKSPFFTKGLHIAKDLVKTGFGGRFWGGFKTRLSETYLSKTFGLG